MKNRLAIGLGVVGVVGLGASVIAVLMVWMLLAAPQQAATAMQSENLVVFGRWMIGALRLVAAWL
jgi:hypothetical protein